MELKYYFFIAILLIMLWLYYKNVIAYDKKLIRQLELADSPKDINGAQDDDFVRLMAAIPKCRNEQQIIKCAKSIAIFRKKYNNVTSEKDALFLFELLEKHNNSW